MVRKIHVVNDHLLIRQLPFPQGEYATWVHDCIRGEIVAIPCLSRKVDELASVLEDKHNILNQMVLYRQDAVKAHLPAILERPFDADIVHVDDILIFYGAELPEKEEDTE